MNFQNPDDVAYHELNHIQWVENWVNWQIGKLEVKAEEESWDDDKIRAEVGKLVHRASQLSIAIWDWSPLGWIQDGIAIIPDIYEGCFEMFFPTYVQRR